MELSKTERIAMMSLVIDSIGVDALMELLGKEDVEKLDVIATEMIDNTTPSEMALIGPRIINKLSSSLVED
ncbi:MAG: hypothetical protein ABS896_09320 [Carnobacterium inhibens]|uniref:hypothetical protein n=1 Tax=Carnobacterium inhibens TaxID=147709 RepID=UPI003314EC57